MELELPAYDGGRPGASRKGARPGPVAALTLAFNASAFLTPGANQVQYGLVSGFTRISRHALKRMRRRIKQGVIVTPSSNLRTFLAALVCLSGPFLDALPSGTRLKRLPVCDGRFACFDTALRRFAVGPAEDGMVVKHHMRPQFHAAAAGVFDGLPLVAIPRWRQYLVELVELRHDAAVLGQQLEGQQSLDVVVADGVDQNAPCPRCLGQRNQRYRIEVTDDML
jgi:hypothetical protein